MGSTFAPTNVRLGVDAALRDEVLQLEADVFERFERAWQFAEAMIGQAVYALKGMMTYFVSYAGMLLKVLFHPHCERFVIVGFADLGDPPDPADGDPNAAASAEFMLRVLGIEAELDALSATPAPFRAGVMLVRASTDEGSDDSSIGLRDSARSADP